MIASDVELELMELILIVLIRNYDEVNDEDMLSASGLNVWL